MLSQDQASAEAPEPESALVFGPEEIVYDLAEPKTSDEESDFPEDFLQSTPMAREVSDGDHRRHARILALSRGRSHTRTQPRLY